VTKKKAVRVPARVSIVAGTERGLTLTDGCFDRFTRSLSKRNIVQIRPEKALFKRFTNRLHALALYYAMVHGMPEPEPNERAVIASCLDVASKARDLLDAMETLGPQASKIMLGSGKGWAQSETRAWLKNLDCHVPELEELAALATAKKGRPLAHPAERWLLMACAKLCAPAFDPSEQIGFQRCVREIACEIHNAVAEKKQKSKFHTSSVPAVETIMAMDGVSTLDFKCLFQGI